MTSSASLLPSPSASHYLFSSSHPPSIPLIFPKQAHLSSTNISLRTHSYRLLNIVASYGAKRVVPYATYVVPIDDLAGSSFITRRLSEILRDMNKKVPEKVISDKVDEDGNPFKFIPWYHANRMLSFYAPGWSGEIRSISSSPDGTKVSVVYRVTIRGLDEEVLHHNLIASYGMVTKEPWTGLAFPSSDPYLTSR